MIPAAAILAWLIVRRAPGHRPWALALTVAALLELALEALAGAEGNWRRVALLAWLGHCAAMACGCWRAWGVRAPWWAAAWLAVATWAPACWYGREAARLWHWTPALGLAAGALVSAMAWWRWHRSGRPRAIMQRTAEIVAAVDLLGAALCIALQSTDHLATWGLVAGVGVATDHAFWLYNIRVRTRAEV
jgi:hypothetical protein